MNGARQCYLKEIIRLVETGEDIVIVSSDFGSPVLDSFKIEYAERFISVGIAEQNLIEVASGMALSGHHVVAYGQAPFPCIRAYDQIRNAVGMMNLPIQIVSVGTGFSGAAYGATHYCTDDMSIIRSIPNMEVITISDEWMARSCARYVLTCRNPVYVRFDKCCDGEFYKEDLMPAWNRGFAVAAKTGEHGLAVVTNSYYISRIVGIAEQLRKEENISLTVIDLFRQPFDRKSLLDILNDSAGVITVEEHILRGGIGTEILELKEEFNASFKLERMGIDFLGSYPEIYGSREFFLEKYDLSDRAIKRHICEAASNKKRNDF